MNRVKNLDHDLNQFIGTTGYFPHFLPNPLKAGKPFLYTDGVQYLAEEYGAYWLTDVLFSHVAEIYKNPAVQDEDKFFLSARLNVKDDDTAVFIMDNGNGKELARQEITFTDFPAREQSFFIVDGIAMLPSEY